jgi:hypothetical protein
VPAPAVVLQKSARAFGGVSLAIGSSALPFFYIVGR